MQFLIILVLLFGLLWLFVIRPQRRRQSEQQSMLASMAEGDEVITAGGLYGYVRGVDDDSVQLEIAPGTQVKIARRAIAAVLRDEPDDEEDIGLVEEGSEGEPAEAARR